MALAGLRYFAVNPAKRTIMRNCLPKAKALALLLLCLGFSTALMAQHTTIHGRVVSGDSALSNVTVMVRGTTGAVQTDDNGAFTLDADVHATLIFSRVGFQTLTVGLNGRHSVDVSLVASNQQMADVIVVGYGTQKRADVTGAVSSVPKDRLSELPVTNLFQAVEGSVAGVSVSNTSSVPGATPIYGTNGSNGVILITTKRGKPGKPVIQVNTYTGFDKLAHVLEPRDGPSYVQKYKDFMTETKQVQTGPVPNQSELGNYSAGKTTDWIKQVTQQGVTTDNSLSISGGSKEVRYYISGEYEKQKGAIKGYQYHRAGVRANLDIDVTDFLTVGTSTYYAYNNYDGGQANLLNATAMSPYGVEYNPNGTYNIYPMYPELLYTNPLLGLYTSNVNHTSTLSGNGYAEVKFGGVVKGLKYRLNAGSSYLPAAIYTYTGRDANNLLGQETTYNSETNHYLVENILTYARDFDKQHIDFTGLYSAEQRKYFVDAYTATGFVNDLLTYNNIGAAATLTPTSIYEQYAATPPPGNPNAGAKGSYQSKYN